MTDTILLDPAVDPDAEVYDHPAVVTDTEAALGQAMYLAVRDLDDYSNGVDPLDSFRVEATQDESSGRGLALARARIVRDVLLRYGVPEVSIELVDGRPSIYDSWNTCKPVGPLSHHIASEPTPSNPTPGLWLVKHGRSDLPGPLCNGTAGVDLVYRIICLGYANHPGTGGPLTLSGPLGSYTVPRDVARPYLWGTEYEGGYTNAVWDKTYTNRRTGASMTFREFMGRANAALCEAVWLINNHGRTPEPGMDLSTYHGEHKTWAPGRKPDRKDYTTESGRVEIRKYAPMEDEVSAKDVWDHPIEIVGDGVEGKTLRAAAMLGQAHNRAGDARTEARQASRQAVANRRAIAEIAETLEGDAKVRVLAALDTPVADDEAADPTS